MFTRTKRMISRLNALLARMRGGPVAVLFIGLFVGVLAVTAFAETLIRTSTQQFCAYSCHEMADNVTMEFKQSSHHINRTGISATCADCHVPKSTIPLYFKKMGAVHDLWGHYVTRSISTREKFEAKRYELAKRVWVYMKSNDSRECRSCHSEENMALEKQSERARMRHERGQREGLTCIDCHFGIVHDEPDGPGPQEIDMSKEPRRVW
jgi:cytochrome c-type protein NapC